MTTEYVTSPPIHGSYHRVDLVIAKLRIAGERKNLRGKALGDGKLYKRRGGCHPAGLPMIRNRIVDVASDFSSLQMGSQVIAVRATDHKKMRHIVGHTWRRALDSWVHDRVPI